MFCAPNADTVESIEDGTRNRKLMIFSTIPTAAATLSPLRLAMIVMMINATWINPSCAAIGTPILSTCPIVTRSGRKSALFTEIPVFFFKITKSDTATLIVCESVVPSAAPAGPI